MQEDTYTVAMLRAMQGRIDELGAYINTLPGEADEVYEELPPDAKMRVLAAVAESLGVAMAKELADIERLTRDG